MDDIRRPGDLQVPAEVLDNGTQEDNHLARMEALAFAGDVTACLGNR